MADAFAFEWAVDQDGYDVEIIVDPERPSPPHFERATITPRGGPLRFYRPLSEHPDLWRRFANSCHTAADAGAFVTQYGPVWSGFLPDHRLVDATGKDAPGVSQAFAHMVTRFYHRWLDTDFSPDAGPPIENAHPILVLAHRLRGCAEALDSGDRQRAAGSLSYQAPEVEEILVWDDSRARFETRLLPLNLGFGLLHQALESVAQNYRWRRCANDGCPAWMRIGTGAFSRRAEYCTDRCRVAASRKRKRQQ